MFAAELLVLNEEFPKPSKSTEEVLCPEDKGIISYMKNLSRKIDSNHAQIMNAISNLRQEFLSNREGKMPANICHEIIPSNQMGNSNLPELPIKSMEELEYLEQLIAMNSEERRNLIARLLSYGGSHLRSVVHNMMNNLLDKNVAVQFTLHGRSHKKRKFIDLKIFTCLQGKCHGMPF